MPAVTYTVYTADQLAALDRDSLIRAWYEASVHSAQLINQERQLRQLAFAKAVPEPKPGINNIDLGGGWLLKAEHKINYTVANTEEMAAQLATMPDHVAERLVKWNPELSISEWKKLAAEMPQSYLAFSAFVTEKPGLPTLKLIEPGGQGNKRT